MVEYLDLDLEWVELILEAKDLGITDEEIRRFFEEARQGEALVGR
ncbi:DNA-binding anti-repressor SinI [Sutcliffiella horikoshii]|uniref:DNA-binding anti-repressor SinI n=1 Tax=Sutcliffiella horikoshii TaxID=79883 RepID=A0AA95B7J8_9BACI|nr:anti-repressor SinI family protein [Sutcliffiella horikoshii]TYS60064.1 DNA-binding anti-repressor SinI [Sutcliffiella horikoshii]